MKRKQTKLSRDTALEIGSILGKYFLKLDHLHYGYWTSDLKLDVANLWQAQQKYTEFLISHIPAGTKTVLDVGCGTGSTAKKLTDLGYRVDCVTPSSFQCEKVRQLCGDAVRVFECEFQKFQTQDKYDLVMFSESFQYVPMSDSVTEVWDLLNKDGHLLICDIFKKAGQESKAIRGGHELDKFYEALRQHPFELVEDIDITDATAPNIELQDDIMTNVAHPILVLGSQYADARYSLASKVVKWLYRKQIKRGYTKYFSGSRTADEFRRTRTYRLLLCRKSGQTPK